MSGGRKYLLVKIMKKGNKKQVLTSYNFNGNVIKPNCLLVKALCKSWLHVLLTTYD